MNEVNPIITFTNEDYFNRRVSPTSTIKIDTKAIQSEPLLLLSPNSILKKSSNKFHHANTSPILVTKYNLFNNGERRPSVVTFKSTTDNDTLLSVSPISEKRPSSISTYTKKKRRPSYLSTGSSVKTTTISIHYNSNQTARYGILLCCTINKKKSLSSTNKQYPIKWREYDAVLSTSPSNSLQLYPICNCDENQQFVHDLFHKHNSYYKRPKLEIQLDQEHFHLSLASPIDFVWSLESDSHLYYFQTNSITNSQLWYQSIYAALPSASKKPLPHSVDVHIPQLDLSVRLPLTELRQGENETMIDLRKVRDSALALLHRHGGLHWHTRSVGLCWKYNDAMDWVVRPDSTQPTNLIEPRLIEKMHVLELWNNNDNITKEAKTDTRPLLNGYLTCKRQQESYEYSCKLIDHYLFINDILQKDHQTFLGCLRGRRRRQQSQQDKIVIDLLNVKEFNEDALLLDDTTRFEGNFIRTLYHHKEDSDNTMIKSVMYVRSHQLFEKRVCLLTDTGDFYCLQQQGDMYTIDFCVSMTGTPSLYMLSGDELCHHIPGLPTEQPTMIFESGMITKDTRPNQCSFIMYYQSMPIVFLTRSKTEKESWVQAICEFLS